MEILFNNSIWMTFNISLAVISVMASLLFFLTKNILKKFLCTLFWFFFFPNTIYMLTDLQHFFSQIYKVSYEELFLLTLQYILLVAISIITFVIGLYSFELFLKKSFLKNQHHKFFIIFFFNYIVAFGVALGRLRRINSWEILTDFENVFLQAITLIASSEGILFTIMFGLLTNVLYIVFSKPIIVLYDKLFTIHIRYEA